MDKLADLKHLFVTVFLANFALNVIPPAITDITVGALCPAQDECSLAIYLSGFQHAVCTTTSIFSPSFLLHNYTAQKSSLEPIRLFSHFDKH